MPPKLDTQIVQLRHFVEEHVHVLRARKGSSLEGKLRQNHSIEEKKWYLFLMKGRKFTPEQNATILELYALCDGGAEESAAARNSGTIKNDDGKFMARFHIGKVRLTGPRRDSRQLAEEDQQYVSGKIAESHFAETLDVAREAVKVLKAAPNAAQSVSTSAVGRMLLGLTITEASGAQAPQTDSMVAPRALDEVDARGGFGEAPKTRQDRRRKAAEAGLRASAGAHASSSLEASFEAEVLQAAQDNGNTMDLNLNISGRELLVPYSEYADEATNTFTGFRNVGDSCFVNAVLQVFLHVPALRQWIQESRHNGRGVSVGIARSVTLQQSLQKALLWHSSGEWSVVVPVRILLCLFEPSWSPSASCYMESSMIAGWQNDAKECFKVFHEALGSPGNSECRVITESFQYPGQLPDDGCAGIDQMLSSVALQKGAILDDPPHTLVLSILPYRTEGDPSDSDSEREWVNLAIVGWDAAIDLSPFFRERLPCSEYIVKAMVYHLHTAGDPVNMDCGHYVAYVKQAQQWHLANDDSVSPVLMSGLRGLPYVMALERKDAPGTDLPAKQTQQTAKEILVESAGTPARLLPRSQLAGLSMGLDHVVNTLSESLQDTELPSSAEGSSSVPDKDSEENASGSEEEKLAAADSGSMQGKPPAKRRRQHYDSREDSKQKDGSARQWDRSGRQQQQDRSSGRHQQRDRSGQQQQQRDRSGWEQQQDRSGRLQERRDLRIRASKLAEKTARWYSQPPEPQIRFSSHICWRLVRAGDCHPACRGIKMTPFSMAICHSECRRLATWVPQLRGEPTAFEPWDGRWPTWKNEEARAAGWPLPAPSPCPSNVPGWCPRSNVIPFTAADVDTDIMKSVSAFTLRHRQHHVWMYGAGVECRCPDNIACMPRFPYRWPMYDMDYKDVIERFIEVDEFFDVPALKADDPEAADMLNSLILFGGWHIDDSGEERWAILENFLWENFTRPYLTAQGFQRPLDVREGYSSGKWDGMAEKACRCGFVDKIEIGPCLWQTGIKDMQDAGSKDSQVAYLRFNADERGCAARDRVLTKIRADLRGNTVHQRWARRNVRRLGLIGYRCKPAPFTHPALKPKWVREDPQTARNIHPVWITPTRRPKIGHPYMFRNQLREETWDLITKELPEVQKFEMGFIGHHWTWRSRKEHWNGGSWVHCKSGCRRCKLPLVMEWAGAPDEAIPLADYGAKPRSHKLP